MPETGAKERERRGASLLHWLVIPAVAYCFSAAAFFRWLQPHPVLVWVNIAAGVAVILNELSFLAHKRLAIAQNIFAAIGVSCLVPMFVTGGVGGAGFAWYFAYLIFAYVLLGPRMGTFWSLTLVAVTALVVLSGTASVPYTTPFLIDAAWAFALSMFLVFVLNLAYERSQRRVEERSAELAAAVEAKSRLAAIVESAEDAILSVDLAGRIESWNAAAERMFGYRAQEAIGQPLAAMAPGRLDEARQDVLAALLTDRHAQQVEAARIRRDGSELAVLVTVSPVRASDREVVGMSIVMHDITERKRAEEQAREIERLRSADALKNALLSTVSHELKTPLTPLKLQTQILESESTGPLNDRQRRSVTILRRNLDRLGSLVQQTLDVARLEGGRMTLERRSLTLGPIVREAVESFEDNARAANVTVRVGAIPDTPVQADAARLTQVLFNLLSNAIKFTPPGGTIEIDAREAGDALRVEVRDSGQGIDPAQIQHLFQPFSRVEDAAQAKKEGTGLGLYISKGIVEAHGGEIGVTSAGAGKGSVFYFTLPREAPASSR